MIGLGGRGGGSLSSVFIFASRSLATLVDAELAPADLVGNGNRFNDPLWRLTPLLRMLTPMAARSMCAGNVPSGCFEMSGGSGTIGGGGVLVRRGVRSSSIEWRRRSSASEGVSGVGSECRRSSRRGPPFFGGVERVMVRSASPSSSSSSIPCICPVFACGALDNRGTSFGGGLTAFGRCTGWGLEGDGRSVDDAEEERWWDDAEDGGKGCECGREERMEVNWVRNVLA